MQSISVDLDYSKFPPSISLSLKQSGTATADHISPLLIDQDGSGHYLIEPLKVPCGQFFDDIVLNTGSYGNLRIINYGPRIGKASSVKRSDETQSNSKPKPSIVEIEAPEYISFPWAAPYFCTEYGSKAWVHSPPPYISRQRPPLFSTAYVDDEGRPLLAAWDIVDEIRHRLGLTTKVILDGKFSEIKNGLKRIIEEERAKMLPK